MYALIKQLVLPPASFAVLIAVGLLLWRGRWHKLGRWLAATGIAALYLFSTPLVSHGLMAITEMGVEPFEASQDAQAIVVLAAGLRPAAPDFGGETVVDDKTFERLRYGAYLHKRTGLPILVSGGPWSGTGVVSADMMQKALTEEFGVKAKWLERRSVITRKNATYSSRILQAEGIDTVVLVTHAWHMPRAKAAFERRGLQVVQAPTAFDKPLRWSVGAFLPQGQAMERSYFATHEILGRIWYMVIG